MYQVELLVLGFWFRVPTIYNTRDDAEWAVARWKQANDIRGDSFFRYIPMET